MRTTDIHTALFYENKWLSFKEKSSISQGNRILVKSLKSDLIDRRSAITKEEAYRKQFDDLKIIQKASEQSDAFEYSYALPPGSPLWQIIQRKKLNLEERLFLAKNLIHIVLSFHKRKLLFYDLSWDIFWYDELDQNLYLLDATMVTPIDQLETRYNVFLMIDSNMYTISPEQTFQSSSIPDIRSNYYSLAIILYALFTGEKPFKGDDRVSIIHKHLSQLPKAPHLVQGDLNIILSNFIIKLLSKNPNDRYQSALGLSNDFNLISDHILNGTSLEDFELGRNDFPLKFTMPDNVFIREDIINKLIEHSEGINAAEKNIVLLQGEEGADSDSIINQFLRLLNYDTYYIGSGKYTLENNLPYS
ncbi:MAG: hypothetical protein HKN09_07485, partial [Saprospiraceae bacterium]|nr:hypothetical protein [Saprospiraceae bacterium]